MTDDDITRPENVVLGLNYLIGKAYAQGSRRAAPILANAIAEIERLRAANADLLASVRLVLPNLRCMPEPRLGEIDWPLLADEMEAAIALATGQEAAPANPCPECHGSGCEQVAAEIGLVDAGACEACGGTGRRTEAARP